jgi:hypothetical protein
MNLLKTFIFCGLFIATLSACETQTAQPLNLYTDYAPFAIGDTTYYQPDSINYDDFDGSVEKYTYRTREVVAEYLPDDQGDSTFIVYVSKEEVPNSGIYKPHRTVAINKRRLQYERVEDNKRILNLVFPIVESKSWLGNARASYQNALLNDFSSWKFTYKKVHKPLNINALAFDSTLMVLQVDSDVTNPISKVYSAEYYAKGVGLIQKDYIVIGKQPNLFAGGVRIYQKIIGYSRRN